MTEIDLNQPQKLSIQQKFDQISEIAFSIAQDIILEKEGIRVNLSQQKFPESFTFKRDFEELVKYLTAFVMCKVHESSIEYFKVPILDRLKIERKMNDIIDDLDQEDTSTSQDGGETPIHID